MIDGRDDEWPEVGGGWVLREVSVFFFKVGFLN